MNLTDRELSFLSFLYILGGLSLFLYGIRIGSRGLQKLAGGRLKVLLYSLTRNPIGGMAAGILITIFTQSSAATSVMLISLANAGILEFVQTLGVLLGADIGTTITVQLIAFKIFNLSFAIIALGFGIMNLAKRDVTQSIGQSIFGFGLVFLGMKIMADSAAPLQDSEIFSLIVTRSIQNPIAGVVVGAICTVLVRSSAVMLGIVLSLSFRNLLTLETAIPLIFGANIGTCSTALLASMGGEPSGKRIAWSHITFKVIGMLIFLPLIGPLASLVRLTSSSLPRQIANAHSIFNIITAFIFLPFIPTFSRVVCSLVSRKTEGEGMFRPKYLDYRVLDTPALAIANATREVMRMADIACDMLEMSMEVFKKNDDRMRMEVISNDDKIDLIDESVTNYLTRISTKELSDEESAAQARLLQIAREIERIGDVVSKSLMTYAAKKINQGFYFSDQGFKEIKELHRRVLDNLKLSINSFVTMDVNLARKVLEGSREIERIEKEFEDSHIQRLKKGLKESLETSTVHLDLIGDLKLIASYSEGIALAVIGSADQRTSAAEKA